MTTREDLVAGIRRRQRPPAGLRTVTCQSVSAIRYRDVIELYMAWHGARDWVWQDASGRTARPNSMGRALANLARDLVAWPAMVLGHTLRLVRSGPAMRQRPRLAGRRVAFLRTDHWFDVRSGGSVGHLSGVIGGLRALGWDTHVISSDRLVGVPEDDHFHPCEPAYGTGRNVPELAELAYNDQLVGWIAPHWAGWAPAFIYQRYSLGNYAGVLLKLRHRVPLVCEYNGSFIWIHRHWDGAKLIHERLLRRIELLNVRAADLVVVVSQPLKDELVARGVAPERVLVNPNGVCTQTYHPALDDRPVRARHGLEGKLVIGFIGTFGPWHGVEVLAEAFRLLLERCPDQRDRLRLLLVGDGVTQSAVRERLAPIADYCVFTGSVPQHEGPDYLAACDVVVLPQVPNADGTPFFGSPTKLFEYMAMGRAIAASDLDQIGELLTHGRTAWLVRPGDPGALMEGLRHLTERPDLREALGREARQEAEQRHSWRDHTQRIVRRLEELTHAEQA